MSEIDGRHLDPCPFGTSCDPELLSIQLTQDRRRRHIWTGYVECMDCGSRGPTAWAAGSANAADLAVYDWNTREIRS